MKISDLKVFDASERLQTEEDIAGYLKMVIAEEAADFFPLALETVAKARGMNQIAKETGVDHGELYRALHPLNREDAERAVHVLKRMGCMHELQLA